LTAIVDNLFADLRDKKNIQKLFIYVLNPSYSSVLQIINV